MPKKEIFIEGDEQRLEQVWTNIISNALKYTNEGGLITITMKKNSKDIEVSIEDTGIGMSKEVVSHIFERFYREDKARNVEGNGLGLAIVKSIVDLPFSTHLLCFCILLFVIRIRLADRKLFLWFRRMSTLIYFSHMFFVATLVYLFPEVYAGLPQFALASVSTFFFSCIVIRLMEVPGFSFLKKLVG